MYRYMSGGETEVKAIVTKAMASNASATVIDALFGLLAGGESCPDNLDLITAALTSKAIALGDAVTLLGDVVATCASSCSSSAVNMLIKTAGALWRQQGASASDTILPTLGTLSTSAELAAVDTLLEGSPATPRKAATARTLVQINMDMIENNRAATTEPHHQK